ncbi:MAG: hypothetical protein H0V06_02395 [Gemmatimonadetes bacterium]|nr:hypothetical protein [Gemmatimonadota bacterium]
MTFRDPEGRFSLHLPSGWLAKPDPEAGGVEVYHPDGAGTLHLLGFAGNPDDFLDPAEELYAFLDEQGVELQDEEVEDLELSDDAELAYTEYVAETDDEEDDEPTFHIMAVATSPGTLVFASYTCPAGEEDRERGTVLSTLGSLRLGDNT